MIEQAGAISSFNLEETIDLVQVLLRAKPPRGPRVGLMAMTGGQSVVMSDAFADAGLEVPLLVAYKYQVVSKRLKNMYVSYTDFNPGLRTAFLTS